MSRDRSAMAGDAFQVLGIAGLQAATPADAFADLPMPDPACQPDSTAAGTTHGLAFPMAPTVPDVLDALHREFRQVLADPWQLVGRAGADAAPAYPSWQAPGPVAENAEPAPAHLLDRVLPHESLDGFIARFVAGLDAAEEPTLLLETRPDEVLQLFAPIAAAAAARHAPLPLTTRRDHHAMSPDSAVRIGAFVAAPAPGSTSMSTPPLAPAGPPTPPAGDVSP